MSTAKALERLRTGLGDGTYGAGSRLPPERELAVLLGVGRSTLRKALANLSDEGRLHRRIGRGTFVADASPSRIEASLVLDPPPSPADIMEVRRMVEPAIAGAAALRATVPEIERLRGLVEECAVVTEWREWEHVDSAFHTAIAAASRNSLLVGILDAMNVMRRQEDWRSLRGASLTTRKQVTYTRQHRAVLSAIIARDAARAMAAMRTHLDTVQETLIAGSSDAAVDEFPRQAANGR